MNGVCVTKGFRNRHARLASMLEGVATSLFLKEAVEIRDVGEPGQAARSVAVAAGTAPGIRCAGKGATLSCDQAVGEGALAALVALACHDRGPIAADPASLAVLALAERLARSEIPVLINGPTGTGKEVLSTFIHQRSDRRDKPFVAVNCAAIPEALLEAMLFGHEKGSFTGASAAGAGFFRAADGGTLLLDEIAEMPLTLQAKLLRALQEGEVVPVGATMPVKVDVRIIACANRDLPLEVAEGRFREDLYYRLNVFPMTLEPLRERRGDIAPLAFGMLLRHTPRGAPVPWIGDEALALLRGHGWPGNVRELENVMRRALLLAHGGELIEAVHIVFDRSVRATAAPTATATAAADTAAAAPVSIGAPASAAPSARAPAEADTPQELSKIVQLSEARAIMETLRSCDGHRANAARRLGISERTLRYRLASFREAGIAMSAAL